MSTLGISWKCHLHKQSCKLTDTKVVPHWIVYAGVKLCVLNRVTEINRVHCKDNISDIATPVYYHYINTKRFRLYDVSTASINDDKSRNLKTKAEIKFTRRTSTIALCLFFFSYIFSFQLHEHPSYYYWAEITGQQTQTINILYIPITGHMVNSNSCRIYSNTLVPHPNTILRRDTSLTKVYG